MPGDSRPNSRDDKVQLLIDKQEIYDALMRYCVGIDRGELDLVLSAFHDDALDNHIGIEERATERFTRTVQQATSSAMITSHNIGNVIIRVDGSVAYSQSYLTAWHRFDIEGKPYDWVIGGRYLDRFERRNGTWRIAHRTVVYDYERFDEVPPKPAGHQASALFDRVVRGTRGQGDFSYQLRGSWGPAA
jgi:hypothetical protein